MKALEEGSTISQEDYLGEGDKMPDLAQTQVENVQIDYGILMINDGEVDARTIGPTRGGGEFSVKQSIRDIEFDGMKGKTKGMQVVESVDALLTVTHLDTSMASLADAMPYATYDDVSDTITCGSANIGVIPLTSYLKNVTMYCKTIKGDYRKITLYNAMSEKEFSLVAKAKGEGEVSLEINAHWDPLDGLADLYKIETVASIVPAI